MGEAGQGSQWSCGSDSKSGLCPSGEFGYTAYPTIDTSDTKGDQVH